jgi:DNA-binding IclR family transcriptional regulator
MARRVRIVGPQDEAGEAPNDAAREARPRYSAPALEKGLDVIELLAHTPDGMTQSQIAQALGRSVQEVYRVLMSLERRGYIQRRPPDDACRLTMRLHHLAHAYPPASRLIDTALPVMRQLALDVRQSFHLSVLDAANIHVLAQADSPAPGCRCVP